jgi:geranylgeranyl pyrophosphate synthase
MLVKMMGAVMQIDNEATNLLTECMNNVGIAFQIIDDVLNVANSEECMGKGIVAEDLH